MAKVQSEQKICSACGVEKALSEYASFADKRYGRRWFAKCNTCRNAANRARYEKDPTKSWRSTRRNHWAKTYGLTPEDVDLMLCFQNHSCACCGTIFDMTKSRPFNIDHCHKTGAVRGILCHHCNKGIGHFSDDVKHLNLAIAYLRRSEWGISKQS